MLIWIKISPQGQKIVYKEAKFKDFMRKWRFVIFLSLLGMSLSHVNAETFLKTQDFKKSCLSYELIDQQLQCGSESYLQQFAIPYCQKYLDKHETFSSEAQGILARIRSCLQTEMVGFYNHGLNCENIESFGVESHEGCYLNSGFCEMNEMDRLKVMWIAKTEVLNFNVMTMFSNVLFKCQF